MKTKAEVEKITSSLEMLKNAFNNCMNVGSDIAITKMEYNNATEVVSVYYTNTNNPNPVKCISVNMDSPVFCLFDVVEGIKSLYR